MSFPVKVPKVRQAARIGGQRDREADPARGGSCKMGKFWIGLPPRRFAPPLLFQEGSPPEFQTGPLPENATAPRLNEHASASTPSETVADQTLTHA